MNQIRQFPSCLFFVQCLQLKLRTDKFRTTWLRNKEHAMTNSSNDHEQVGLDKQSPQNLWWGKTSWNSLKKKHSELSVTIYLAWTLRCWGVTTIYIYKHSRFLLLLPTPHRGLSALIYANFAAANTGQARPTAVDSIGYLGLTTKLTSWRALIGWGGNMLYNWLLNLS